jgi:DNA-directed RNA polymerase subunit omega
MNRIALDVLLEKVESRYSLVIAAAKRARQLTDAELEEGNKEFDYKVVSYALQEIAEDDIQVFQKNKHVGSAYELK